MDLRAAPALARLPAALGPGAQPFAHVAERMSDGMVVIGPEGLVNYCNPALARLLGRTPAQVIGRPLTDFLSDEGAREFHSRQPGRRRGLVDSYVLGLRHADGHFIERLASPTPLFGEDGRFEGSVGIVSIATGRAPEGEAALARRVIDSSESIAYRANASLHIDFVSGNISQLGYSPATLAEAHTPWLELVHPHDQRRLKADFDHQLAEGVHPFRRQYRLLTTTGQERWFDEESVVCRRSDGTAQWIEGLLRDVTALHEAQEATRQALAQTVAMIGTVVEKRDPYTGLHQHRVADLSLAIGRRLGLQGAQLQGLYLGALIHDIGKVAVPSELLARPGRLSPEELALVRTHVQVGVDLIAGTEFPWPLVRIIAEHHERLDGSGYPNRLRGDALLLESRIVAVADVFEAMGAHRPYRPSLGVAAALEELQRQRGRLYCAACVDACTGIVESHGGTLPGLWEALGEQRLGIATTEQLALDLGSAAA